jgi:hypothetical protein
MTANMAGSGRARGFSVDVVLNQSIHPFTLVQVLIADLYGDLSRLPDRWWGSNFFDRGFPYIVSLYLGAATVALAILGALAGKRVRVWLALGGVALLVALGRWGGMAAMVGWVPESWRLVRFPTKAFFTVHLVTAVLAGFGLDALVRAREAWRRVSIVLGGLGLPLVLLMVWPALLPGAASWFTAHFFPPALAVPTRMADFDAILRDGVSGGTMAVLAAAVALLVYRARLRPVIGAWLVTAIVAADLIRAGAGLNPMVATSWFATSPEVVAAVGAHGVRRVFSCDVEGSREYWEARRLRPGDHEMMTFGASRDTLTPHTNRSLRVETALSADLTSLVPLSRLLPAGVGCADPAALLPWLRGAGVTHVLSLDRMEAAGLHHTADVAPGRISPLHVNLFEVQGVPPPYYVARRVRRGARPPDMPPDSSDSAWIDGAPEDVEGATGAVRSVRDDPEAQVFEVDASRATALVVLDGWFPGWEAAVDGRPVPVLAAGHHRAVWVPAGHARVTFEYHPRGLRAGLALSTVSAILLVILGCGPWRPSAPLTPDRERDLVSVST